MCDRWSRYAQLMQEGEEKLLMRMLRPFDADLADGPMQMTIAHLAAEYGQVWMLKELHAQGVRLNRVTARGDTIAHIAARNGQHEVLAWLASLGTNCPDLWLELPQITYRAGIALEHILHAARPDGERPLTLAALCGHVGAVRVLARVAREDHIRTHPEEEDEANGAGGAPIDFAGGMSGVDGSTPDAEAAAAAAAAAEKKKKKKKRGDPMLRSSDPLLRAEAVSRPLLTPMPRRQQLPHNSGGHLRSMLARTWEVEQVAAHGGYKPAGADALPAIGGGVQGALSPARAAARAPPRPLKSLSKPEKAARQVLEGVAAPEAVPARVDVNATNGNGSTAAHLAAAAGSVELLAVLRANGADLGAANTKYGRAPIDWAAEAGHEPARRMLAGLGYEPTPPPPPQPKLLLMDLAGGGGGGGKKKKGKKKKGKKGGKKKKK